MKHIICGSNRQGSNSLKVCKVIQALYKAEGEDVEIIDLTDLPMNEATWGDYKGPHPVGVVSAIEKINKSEGLIVVCPEYNGSMPGALKFFIDHWSYPESFEQRPVCFVGLGGRFGGLRPVEHLQGVFGYRNAFMFPVRVFLMNIWAMLDSDDQLTDEPSLLLLKKQVSGFQKFTKALNDVGLHANQLEY